MELSPKGRTIRKVYIVNNDCGAVCVDSDFPGLVAKRTHHIRFYKLSANNNQRGHEITSAPEMTAKSWRSPKVPKDTSSVTLGLVSVRYTFPMHMIPISRRSY